MASSATKTSSTGSSSRSRKRTESASTLPPSLKRPDLWPIADRVAYLNRFAPPQRSEAPPLSLSEFVRAGWHVVEPATPFVGGRHIDAICALLTAITEGDERNAVVNIPPRHMKSLLVSVFWPCWVWTFRPEARWLFASYSYRLAIRDSLKCRRLIQSPWYQERWGAAFRLAGDQNEKGRFENDRTGYRIATGVGGTATGEGGDFVVVDDPHKAQDAASEVSLETACTWWDETMSTRGNDPRTVAKVVVMQRLSERDLTGHILGKMREGGERYEHLMLPAEYEAHDGSDHADWRDWRDEPGALLWPERFGPAEIANLKGNLGEEGTAGQLQQRPAPAGGAIYKAAWWEGVANRYDPADERARFLAPGRWLSFDTALKDGEANDYTGCVVADLTADYRLAVRDVWERRLTMPNLLDAITDTALEWNRDGKLRGILIEDKGSGTSAYQTLRASAAPWLSDLLVAFLPQGSKVYRAKQASLWCEKGCVLLPFPSVDAPWLFDFERRLGTFPHGLHDDIEDAFSMAILFTEHLLSAGYQARREIAPEVAA
jgi:predicted phage terminase large subunit-like protein